MQAPTGGHEQQQAAQEVSQPLPRVVGAGGFFGDAGRRHDLLFEKSSDQFLLVGKMPVSRGYVDAGLDGDVVEGDGQATGEEQTLGRVD